MNEYVFLGALNNGSKDLDEAYLFSNEAIGYLGKKFGHKIKTEKYRVFITTPKGSVGWVDSGGTRLEILPHGVRLGRLPLTKMLEMTGGNLDMIDFMNVPKVLGQLGLVEAMVSLDGLLTEGKLLRIKFA